MKTLKSILLGGLTLLLVVSCGEPKNAQEEAKLVKTALIARTGKLWKNKSTVIVTFKDGTPEIKAEVERFAKEWTKYANLNFKFYPSAKEMPFYSPPADITITFNTNVHTSAVGTDSRTMEGGIASMNLGILNDKNINTRRSIILHEFGHAIGLEHEHQHKDRTLEFDQVKAIEACNKHINFTEEMCKMFILQTFKEGEAYFSKYDLFSIMHYSLHGDFFKEKIQMKANLSLSLTDKLEIAKIYPGRATAEQILVTHEAQQIEIAEISTYKNCKIREVLNEYLRPTDRGTVEMVPVKNLIIVSKVPGELEDNSMWEDRESTIIRMKSLEYCNLSEEELAASRAKQFASRLEQKNYGSCQIVIDSQGQPNSKMCLDKNFPFQIENVKTKNSADNLCHPTFDSALSVMKRIPPCR